MFMKQIQERGGVFANQSGIGGILKALAIIIAILGLIGGFTLGSYSGGVSEYLRSGGRSAGGFSFPIALSAWLVCAVFCALVYAAGEIVEHLAAIRQALEGAGQGKAAFLNGFSARPEPAVPARPDARAAAQPAVPASPEKREPAEPSDPGSEWVYCWNCREKAARPYAKARKTCPKCGAPYAV